MLCAVLSSEQLPEYLNAQLLIACHDELPIGGAVFEGNLVASDLVRHYVLQVHSL